ncbi:ABC transporter ATP-binding protein [Bogoriella caseilytica]|uniref:Iron complex transport system ATP-binding protein n=1 Tax=Bogoriella caseilytica TaxID=56055 RepID=A0A3N2BDY5_9MICO|nr:ABC transporter ATP-binding protein [Bogoriella caseilytica]ROR73470.1 iron complex transport system ATP-binding protein [Bogoriella caseilytica]
MTDPQVPGTGIGTEAGEHRLSAECLTAGYDARTVLEGLDLHIPEGSFTVIIGPNACGKSTLLRSLARLIRPKGGQVLLDGSAITSLPTKQLARTVGLLPQGSVAPEGITVADLVARGRHPHQSLFKRWGVEDEAAVREALQVTGTTELATRAVDELSGGQRQRTWIAMALAQQTPILLLDEPTTYLDIAHQIEVLELCTQLRHQGRTLVAVLHDLNHALRYATHLVAMRDGAIVDHGSPERIGTAELVEEVFGVAARVIDDPETGRPLVIPKASPAHLRTSP